MIKFCPRTATLSPPDM